MQKPKTVDAVYEEVSPSTNHIKDFFLGLSAIVIYFVGTFMDTLPLNLLHLDYENWNPIGIIAYSLGYEILLIAIIIAIFHKPLKEQLTNYIIVKD